MGGGEKVPVPMKQWGFWKYQLRVRAFYSRPEVQWAVAALIMLNFGTNVVQAEIDPQTYHYTDSWKALEHTFNALFLLELLVNAYSYWLCQFWMSSWNIFDLIVVTVGCIGFGVELVGPMKLLRTLRAFR